MIIYDHVVLGDGPVGRSLVLHLLARDKYSRVLHIDAGKHLRHLNSLQNVSTNISYEAFIRQPSFNKKASEYQWAGGCQGWPEFERKSNRQDAGLLTDIEVLNRGYQKAAELFGISNFDFNKNLPIEKFTRKRFEKKYSMNKSDSFFACAVIPIDFTLENRIREETQSPRYHRITDQISIKLRPNLDHVIVSTYNPTDSNIESYLGTNIYVTLGAIESTRLILNSQDELGMKLNPHLGKHLSDHLSLGIGQFETDKLGELMYLFGRISNKNQQLWPRQHFTSELYRLNYFAHLDQFKPKQTQITKFKILRKLEFNKYSKSIPISGFADLNLFFEKRNDDTSSISLAGENNSVIPNLDIKFNIDSSELESIKKAISITKDFFTSNYDIKFQESFNLNDLALTEIYSGVHPSGTLRMSQSIEDGVVNPKCELWGHENIKLFSSAVFLRASSIHPTFLSIALALGLS